MGRASRWIRLLGGVVVAAALLTSCTKASGGGWIVSATGEGKATFGFHVTECEETIVDSENAAAISGEFQYNDGPAGVRFHSDAFGYAPGFTCDVLAELFPLLPGETSFFGIYRTQPKGEEGAFEVFAVDGGEPGQADDAICITLQEPVPYQNCQPLGGGNIQVESSD